MRNEELSDRLCDTLVRSFSDAPESDTKRAKPKSWQIQNSPFLTLQSANQGGGGCAAPSGRAARDLVAR